MKKKELILMLENVQDIWEYAIPLKLIVSKLDENDLLIKNLYDILIENIKSSKDKLSKDTLNKNKFKVKKLVKKETEQRQKETKEMEKLLKEI